jgi:hypothetical protein
MRRNSGGALLLALAVTGCVAANHPSAKGAALCKQMTAELTTLSTISTSIHLQNQYATPLDAGNAIAAVQAIAAATAQQAVADHLSDLSTPFNAAVASMQAFQANVLSQDVVAQPGVVSQMQNAAQGVHDACARYSS